MSIAAHILKVLTFALLISTAGLSQVISEIWVCENVSELNCVSPATLFDRGKRAYCWMRVTNAPAGGSILVSWYSNGIKRHTTALRLPYQNMRTYAYKTLYENGDWRVDVTKADGSLLRSFEFLVVNDKREPIFDPHAENPIDIPLEGSGEPKETNLIHEPSKVVTPTGWRPGMKIPAIIMLPYTGGTSADFFRSYRSEVLAHEIITILPGGAGSTDDHTWQGFAKAITRYENRLKNDLPEIIKKYNLDSEKIILAGFSLGGRPQLGPCDAEPRLVCGSNRDGKSLQLSTRRQRKDSGKKGLSVFSNHG